MRLNNQKSVPHYGLRKLTVGVASVLLSTTIYLGVGAVNGHAAPANDGQATTQLDHTSSTNQTSPNSSSISLAAPQPANSSSNQSSAATSAVNSASAANPQSSSATVTQLPAATQSIDNLVGNQANQIKVTTATVSQTTGDVAAGTPGQTKLQISLDAPASVIRNIQAGDYINIKLGLPYTINGQNYIMSYGAINPEGGVITYLYWDSHSHDQLVGYIKAVGDVNGYQQTVAINGGAPQVITNHNNQSDSLGTSNGYFQIVFTDGFQQYLNSHVGNSGDWKVDLNLNYYNALQDATKKAQKPSFDLYGDTAGTYTPNNDLQIGDYQTGSRMTFNVVKAHNDVVTSNQTAAIDHSGNVPAHRWAEINGQFVIGVPDVHNPAATPQQGVGVSLSSQKDADGNPILSNHFEIQVTKPADDPGVLSMNFVPAASLQDQLQQLIVPKSNNSQLEDQVTGTDNYLSNQYLYSQPTVHVTSETSNGGNTITYHVTVDGEYGGFRANSGSNDNELAIVTLITWMPNDVNGLLPPENIQNPREDNAAVTYSNPSRNQWFAGYPVRDSRIKDYLMTRPWSVKVSNAHDTFLNTKFGYWIDRSTDYKPGNAGDASTYFYGFVNETIHYVDQHGATMQNNGQAITDAHATVGFVSDPTADNSFHDREEFNDVPVPQVQGYASYAGTQNGNSLVIEGGLAQYQGDAISQYGYYAPFTYPHDDVVLYVVYVPNSQPTQPTPQTQPTKPTTPTEPTQPTKPTTPTTPTEPTQPTKPTVPTEPTQPSQPTSPTKPTQPKGKVTEPTQPTNPTNPTAPTQPTEPTAPTAPTAPTQPSKPSGVTQPTSPVQPTSVTTPVNPTPSSVVPQPVNSKPQQQKLPQTGNSHNLLGLIGLGLAQLLALIGLSKTRHDW